MERATIADFALGLWERPGLDLKQPQGAVLAARNVYVDDDGVLRGRGRMGQRVATALGQAGVFVWAGALLPGFREIAAGCDGTLNSVLKVLSTAGTSYLQSRADVSGTVRATIDSYAVFGNLLVMGVGSSLQQPYLYGGSLEADITLTGVQRTAGSAVMTRAAGGFSAGVDVGMMLIGFGSGGSGPAVVQSVESDTQITVDRPSPATDLTSFTFAGPPYSQRLASVSGVSLNGQYAAVGGRAVVLNGRQVRFSDGPDPATGAHRTYSWPTQNLHEFPNDATGIAIVQLGDRVIVFTQAGNFAISGMAYEIVDGSGNPQHSIERLTGKSVALGRKGIVSWQGALIVPCRDGVYAIDGVSSPVLLSRGLPWAEMVRGGLVCGWATIFQGRYLLPVTYGGQTWTYVFRLDGVETARGTVFPISRAALPGNPVALATSSADKVLAVGSSSAGVLEAGELFTTTSTGTDYNGSRSIGGAQITVGPFPLGGRGIVRRVRMRYTCSEDNVLFDCYVRSIEPGESAPSGGQRSAYLGTSKFRHTTEWIAFDLPQPLQADSVVVEITINGAKGAADFALHAVEVQYRAAGGL